MSRPLALAALCLASTLALGCDQPQPEPTQPPVSAEAPSCPGADAVDGLWSGARREQLSSAWEELPGEWPLQLVETLDERIGERGQAWRSDYAEACAGEEGATMRCLDEQLARFDAALGLAAADPSWTERLWPEVDAALAGATGCVERDPIADTDEVDAASWSRIDLQRRYLEGEARVEALTASLAQIGEGRAQEPASVALSRAQSEVWIAKGEAARSRLEAARALAEGIGPAAKSQVARLEAELAAAGGQGEASLAAIEQSVTFAREQGGPWLLVDQLHALGRLRLRFASAPDVAVAPLTEAIALATRTAGAESPRAAEVQLTLAAVLTRLDKTEAAYDLLTQARDSFVLHLGPDHPRTLETVESIGHLFFVAGQPGDAQYAYLDLLDIYDQLYGPKHWRVARVKVELGDALMAMEQHDSARRMYTEALTPIVKRFGPDDRDAVRSVVHLGIAELALGNLDEAETQCGRGANLAKALPADDPLADEAARCLDELAVARKRAKKKRRR